jgi:hypothetical protein
VRRPRPKKSNQAQDTGKESGVSDGAATLNPDPAVFEAAFVLDDSEDPSRAGTPKPAEKNDKEMENAMARGQTVKNQGPEIGKDKTTGANAPSPSDEKEKGKDPGADSADVTRSATPDQSKKLPNADATPATATATATANTELPLEVRVKLRKFDRLEATYTGWLILYTSTLSTCSCAIRS